MSQDLGMLEFDFNFVFNDINLVAVLAHGCNI